jgi:hypothetical protein
MNGEIGRQSSIILFGNNEALQFHFWKYINHIYIYHRPFICSADKPILSSVTIIERSGEGGIDFPSPFPFLNITKYLWYKYRVQSSVWRLPNY